VKKFLPGLSVSSFTDARTQSGQFMSYLRLLVFARVMKDQAVDCACANLTEKRTAESSALREWDPGLNKGDENAGL
jgi:hypothetical protein